MTFKSSVVYGLLSIGLWISSGFHSTVNAQGKDYRRVSLSLWSGLTFENGGDGFNLFDSRFNVVTETSGIFGMGVQYAITPAWSVEGGYAYTQIKGESGSFKTNMNILSFKNIISLNQLLFTNRITNVINPYLTGGIGYDIYHYKSSATTADNASLSYNIGAGLAFKISPTVDLFGHYQYQLSSNKVDNIIGMGGGLRGDVLTNLTGGIRINFGKKGTSLASWRPVPVEVAPSDYKHLLAEQERAKKRKTQLAMLKEELKQKDRQLKERDEAYTNTISELKEEKAQLREQLRAAGDSLAALASRQKKADCDCKTASIPAGHYVQIFASIRLQASRSVLENTAVQLQNLLDPGEDVFIAKRNQYYEVFIGALNYHKAEEVLSVMKKNYGDAFIITFPRAQSLRELYNNIKKIK